MSEPTNARSEPTETAVDDHVDGELGAGEEQVSQGNEVEQVLSVEALLDDLDRVTAERDSYLDDSRRIAADFTNFRRQVDKRNAEIVEHAASSLAEKLLPTLDACEAAVAHGSTDVEAVFSALLGVLEREGLERIRPEGEPFDPMQHDAVMHEEGDTDAPVVAEVLRTGYAWKTRVLRPAMVKVRG